MAERTTPIDIAVELRPPEEGEKAAVLWMRGLVDDNCIGEWSISLTAVLDDFTKRMLTVEDGSTQVALLRRALAYYVKKMDMRQKKRKARLERPQVHG